MPEPARKQALEDLRVYCKDLKKQHGEIRVDNKSLNDYLCATATMTLSQDERLAFLIGYIHEWAALSSLFRCMLNRNSCPGTYGMWISLGLEELANTTFSAERKKIIADELPQILAEARKLDESGFSFHTGLLYYLHPLRDSNESYFLQQAIAWWIIAVQRAADDGELDADLLCHLAHAYFEIGDLRSAKHYYDQIDMDRLRPEGMFGSIVVKLRLAKCEGT